MAFEVTDFKTIGSALIALCELDTKQEYDKVTIQAKVVKLHEPQAVTTDKIKQDVVVANATRKTTVTLCESYVNTLQLHASYQVSRVTVRIFMGKCICRYLLLVQPLSKLVTSKISILILIVPKMKSTT